MLIYSVLLHCSYCQDWHASLRTELPRESTSSVTLLRVVLDPWV